jgi:hypothetical protein
MVAVTETPEDAHVMAAFARSTLPCPGCGLPGVQGTPWNPCCGRFSTSQIICNNCHTFTPAAAYERTGCAQRVKIPPCGNDDDNGIVHGEGHLNPTPAEMIIFTRNYNRIKAMRTRQAASTAARLGRGANLVASGEDEWEDDGHHINVVMPGAGRETSATRSQSAPLSGQKPTPPALVRTSGPQETSESHVAPDVGGSKSPMPDQSHHLVVHPKSSSSLPSKQHSRHLALHSTQQRPSGHTPRDVVVSTGLTLRWYVVTGQLLPLLSQTALEQAVSVIGGNIEFTTTSSPPAATLRYHPLVGDTIALQGRREHGYTVFRMRPIDKFRFVVDPNGNVVMIYDTGAQVCVMGSEHAHLLTNREPPPQVSSSMGQARHHSHVLKPGRCISPSGH